MPQLNLFAQVGFLHNYVQDGRLEMNTSSRDINNIGLATTGLKCLVLRQKRLGY